MAFIREIEESEATGEIARQYARLREERAAFRIFVTDTDVQSLRAAGFEDEEILHANLIAAYFNFVNRIALGLGVAHSADEITGYKA